MDQIVEDIVRKIETREQGRKTIGSDENRFKEICFDRLELFTNEEITALIHQLSLNSHQSIYDIPIQSSNKVFGFLIVGIKKFIRKMLGWLLEPLFKKTTDYNGVMFHTLNALRSNQEAIVFNTISSLEQYESNLRALYNRILSVESRWNEKIDFYDNKIEFYDTKTEFYDTKIELYDTKIELYDTKINHYDQFQNQQEQKCSITHENVLSLEKESKEKFQYIDSVLEYHDKVGQHHQELLQMLQKTTESIAEEIKYYKSLTEDNMQYLNWKWNQGYTGQNQQQETESTAISMLSEVKTTALSSAKDLAIDKFDYFLFENVFRGSKERILQEQSIYLEYFKGQTKKILDVGCGRGEFLELMRQNNIPAYGVDIYKDFVNYNVDHGFEVYDVDVIRHLEELPDNSLGGLFAGQIVEHLTETQIHQLISVSYQKLAPNSYIVIETPNPTTLAIFYSYFYADLSHHNPVHPSTLQYLLSYYGFKDVSYKLSAKKEGEIPLLQSDQILNLTEFNQSIEEVNKILFGYQNYAVIGKK